MLIAIKVHNLAEFHSVLLHFSVGIDVPATVAKIE
jgi:hypothetical protein